MSFVLEALKKQEAGSDPDAAVSLARAAFERRRYRLWVGLFAVAMAANGALLYWMFGPRLLESQRTPAPAAASADSPAAAAQRNAAAQRSAAAPQRAAAQPGAAEPAQPMATVPAGQPQSGSAPDSRAASARRAASAGADPVAASPPAEAVDGPVRVHLADLPAAARARFPGIAFSTHVYSEDPELRAVVANGHRLREGDRIRGLKIAQITERGVVLEFEDYLVEVPIVVDWDSLTPPDASAPPES